LTHVLALTDTAIVVVKELNKELGEIIISLDLLGIKDGIVVFSGYVENQKFKDLVKGTTLESFIIPEPTHSEIYRILNEKEIPTRRRVGHVVDAFFDVKSVGTVVLSVAQEEVNVHDKLQLYPTEKIAMVKSMQVHDHDVKTVQAGSRVGFSLKGIKADEIERGYILAKPGSLKITDTLTAKFTISKYYKDPVEVGKKFHIALGMQFKPATVEENKDGKITLKLASKVAYAPGEQFLLLRPEGKMRIVGVCTLE